MLEVLASTGAATIQDLGRPEYVHLGVPVGGACDPRSVRIANLLLGNDAGAPALEMTLGGPSLGVRATCVVALAGADLGAFVPEEDRSLDTQAAHLLRAGTTLTFGGSGVRGYIALSGGIDVPLVLGSASTCLPGGFGGIDGRVLQAGDLLRPRHPGRLEAAGRRWPASQGPPQDGPLRIVAGPGGAHFPPRALADLCGATWTATTQSDRVGVRLDGPGVRVDDPDREAISEGVAWGSIQIPPDGRPIVLLADRQTVGGYPVLGVVAGADLPRLGQIGPGDRVTFRQVTVEYAQQLYGEAAAALEREHVTFLRDRSWDDEIGQIRG